MNLPDFFFGFFTACTIMAAIRVGADLRFLWQRRQNSRDLVRSFESLRRRHSSRRSP